MNPVMEIIGYISAAIIGAALVYCAIRAVSYLSDLSDKKNSKLLNFISVHSYGCTIAMIFIFIGLATFASYATMERLAYEALEEERSQLHEEIDSYYDSGYETGYDEGRDEGYAEGFDDGLDEGMGGLQDFYNDGHNDGYRAGYDDGYEEGFSAGFDADLE